MGWVSTTRVLLEQGFYRENLDRIVVGGAEAVASDHHRVCAFVIRDVATELSRLWDHAVPTEWAESCQKALWPKLHSLLDILSVPHSPEEVLTALNQIIELSEAIVRAG